MQTGEAISIDDHDTEYITAIEYKVTQQPDMVRIRDFKH